MCQPLVKLKQLLSKGLEQTGTLWPSVTLATDWVYQAATILNNQAGLKAHDVQQSLNRLLLSMSHWKEQTGEMADEINHFCKVTRSYESGLFHCYQVEGLPRTNNDLEQAFGQLRHHQRRVTGRKAAPASLVLRGSVQLLAAVATRIQTFTVQDFGMTSVERWQDVRSQLQKHHAKRIQQRRFRRSPDEYLATLEPQFLQLALPH